MPTRDTKVPHPDDKPSHRGEYEALRDEIKLLQHEMHQTWLWAVIPAGAVYAWLASATAKGSPSLPAELWFIPVVLVLLCGIRYLVFACRINQLVEYQCDLEEDAFGREGKLRGIASCHRKDFFPMISIVGAWFVWGVLMDCAIYLSCEASKMGRMQYIFVASLVWVILAIYPICLSWKLRQNGKDSDPAPAGGSTAQASPLVPIQPAPSTLAPPVVSSPAASSPATSQPTNKP